MATSTTNLGLIKPAGTDKIRIAQINGNMDIIDEKVGAVGNTSLQTQVTGLGVNLAGLEDCVGIVVDGAKSAVAASAGQYIVLKNSIISGCDDGLYTAAQAIPADTTIDSTYLTAVSGGGLNALNTQIANLIKSDTISGTTDGSGNLMIYNGIRNVVSVSISGGYLASPFYYDNKTYIVVANGSFVPQTSKAVTGTYKYV